MKFTKKLFYLFGIMLAIVSFQNCGMQFAAIQNPLNFASKQSGNGGGYEGKPDGTYYHFIPSYTCEGKPAAAQITELRNGQAFLYANQNNQCSNQSTAVAIEELGLSPFQSEFISVKDVLFKRYEEKPAGVPENLAEVLCRDNFENPTFEIVSHYDREKNRALARIYLPHQQIADFSVSRLLSSGEVRYVADNVTFTVNLSKPAATVRKFAGAIEKTSIAGLAAQPLICVIGGSVDTSKWTLKPLTKGGVGGFQLLKNNEIHFFSEFSRHNFSPTLYQTVTHLYKIDTAGVVSDITEKAFGENYDVKYRAGKVNDSLYLYYAKKPGEMWPSLFIYDTDKDKAKRLTNLKPNLDNHESFTFKRPVITASKHLVFDTYLVDKYLSSSLLLKIYSFEKDSIEDVVNYGVEEHGGYSVLPKTNKLLLYFKNKDGKRNVLQVLDVKTRVSRYLQMSLPDDCVLNISEMEPLEDEASILTERLCGQNRFDVVLISMADGRIKVLSEGGRVTWLSDNRQKIVMSGIASGHLVYDLRTSKTTKIPIDPNFASGPGGNGATDFLSTEKRTKIALAEDRFLFGFGGTESAATLYRVDLHTGESTPMCEGALGRKLYIGQLPNEKVFLLTYDATAKVYRFYQAKSSAECERINEFPSTLPHVPGILPTNIGFALLLGKPLTVYENNTNAEAVFVPLDGRPPLKFNTHTKGDWQIEVSEDKNRIILWGSDTDRLTKIFSFDL